VTLLGIAIVTTMRTYRFGRLRLVLCILVFDDLRQALTNSSSFDPNGLEMTRRAAAALEQELAGIDLASISSDEKATDEIAAAILAPADGANVLATVPERRAEQFAIARRNLAGKVQTRPPATVARRREVWIGIEIAKAVLESFRHVGANTVRVLLRRAGQDVTAGSVAGLVLGILSWYFQSQYQGDFYDYIGGGVTLGAFGGLAFTAGAVTREAAASQRRSDEPGGVTVALTLLVTACVVVGIELVMYLRPWGWPGFPPG